MGAIRKHSPALLEERLTARVHHRVGGSSKLAHFADASLVRATVLRALADESASESSAARIARGELSPLERRVVRTVTNRGAAVRSRERTRREVEMLRGLIAERDARIARLTVEIEAVRRGMCGGRKMEGEIVQMGEGDAEREMTAEEAGGLGEEFPGMSFLGPSLDRAAFSAIVDSLT